MPRGRRCKGFVSCDQTSPLCQGSREVKAVVDRLIEIEGYRVGGGDVTGRRQQFDRDRLDCRKGPRRRDRA